MERTKTAVEWLAAQLSLNDRAKYNGIIEQAKEMERKQIIEAHNHGYWEGDDADGDDEKYYNETYKSE